MSDSSNPLRFLEDVPMAQFTTLGVGGPARWFTTATCEDHIREAVRFASGHRLRLFVLGGGSNLLVSDAGFPGLVVQIALRGTEVQPASHSGHVLVDVAAGESWDDLVQFAVQRDLAGIECLAGIPGTVGGTPVQNVGAYGQEVSQTIRKVRCFDRKSETFVEMDATACGFGYRTSRFNTTEQGRYIVTGVQFELEEHGRPNLSYGDLQRCLAKVASPGLAETAEAVRAIRRGKGMVVQADDPDSRSAGSFFKNPVVDYQTFQSVAEAAAVQEDAVPHWPAADSQVKLPAAWLLERAGFVRGYKQGKAAISSKHTLALINRGGAMQRDIVELRDTIVAGVQTRFGIALEQEPVNVN